MEERDADPLFVTLARDNPLQRVLQGKRGSSLSAATSALVLRDCGLSVKHSKPLAALCAQMRGLTTLDLSRNKLKSSGVAALAAALPATSVPLATLVLDNNGAGNSGMAALAAAVSSPPCQASLTRLDVSRNEVSCGCGGVRLPGCVFSHGVACAGVRHGPDHERVV